VYLSEAVIHCLTSLGKSETVRNNTNA